MRLIGTLATALATVVLTAAAPAPADLQPARLLDDRSTATTAQIAHRSEQDASRTEEPAAVLDQADVDAWLDGFLPYALDAGDIGGAVVVVVKDGRVLTARGFGHADVKTGKPIDPETTLFRPGSTSKLFTWTAVMQLVQAGKLDLDHDINDYLDFKIPPAFGKPVTMRNLLTHTGGFAETNKYLLTFDPSQLRSLDQAVKRFVPERIYAPGTMAAYSNYGALLAGYVVQRVSGEPFAAYVEHHIFAQLGMTHSSFVQPLPPALTGLMSSGYGRASEPAKPFELIAMSPAGALSSSGTDMARFMIAHLQGGGPLLTPQTTQLMHRAANTPVPGLPGMALGFYHEDRNGQTIVGHGGDTDQFHSDLHLYLDRGVGLFVSFNSAGKEGAAHVVRERLFDGFTDRYFPYAQPTLPTVSTARAHGAAMIGHYVSSRASAFTFLRLVALLGETSVVVNDDDTITASSLTDTAGVPKRWREVAPWQWVEVGGSERLNAVVKDGHVVLFSIGAFAPIIEFMPAPAALNAGWILPLLVATLTVMLLTALSWSIVALIRRSYRFETGLSGRALLVHRLSRATAWCAVIVAAGWLAMFQAISSDVTALDGRLDIWIRLMQLVSLAFFAGTIAAIWNAALALNRPGWFPKIWAIVFAASALFLVWLTINAGLVTPALDY